MNKNHFFIGYFGNKRNEFNLAYEQIKDRLEEVEYIVEPFCGTSAFSYFLSLKHPKRFKYILNDNCKQLIECYKIFKDDEKREELIKQVKEFNTELTKEKYINIINIDEPANWFFKNKVFKIRPGLYPLKNNFKLDKLNDAPIINFLKNEECEFLNLDGIEVLKKYMDNKKAIVFLDPPYLMSNNAFYDNPDGNIYEFISSLNLKKKKAVLMLILEQNWILKMLFKKYTFVEYEKNYRDNKSRKTTHFILLNH